MLLSVWACLRRLLAQTPVHWLTGISLASFRWPVFALGPGCLLWQEIIIIIICLRLNITELWGCPTSFLAFDCFLFAQFTLKRSNQVSVGRKKINCTCYLII